MPVIYCQYLDAVVSFVNDSVCFTFLLSVLCHRWLDVVVLCSYMYLMSEHGDVVDSYVAL